MFECREGQGWSRAAKTEEFTGLTGFRRINRIKAKAFLRFNLANPVYITIFMKLVILDRDGVINHDSDAYIKSPEEWRPIAGSLEAIARLHREGYKVLVATNQSGVARGLLDMDMLGRIHAKMVDAVRAKGGELDGIFFCPHGPDDGCRCRKPEPGLYEEIADRLKISLDGVYAVGDSERDVISARAAAARPA